jgi:hypothetical protein
VKESFLSPFFFKLKTFGGSLKKFLYFAVFVIIGCVFVLHYAGVEIPGNHLELNSHRNSIKLDEGGEVGIVLEGKEILHLVALSKNKDECEIIFYETPKNQESVIIPENQSYRIDFENLNNYLIIVYHSGEIIVLILSEDVLQE